VEVDAGEFCKTRTDVTVKNVQDLIVWGSPLLRQLRLATIKHERRTMTQPYSVRLSALFPVSTS
jgi:hypothetical protein